MASLQGKNHNGLRASPWKIVNYYYNCVIECVRKRDSRITITIKTIGNEYKATSNLLLISCWTTKTYKHSIEFLWILVILNVTTHRTCSSSKRNHYDLKKDMSLQCVHDEPKRYCYLSCADKMGFDEVKFPMETTTGATAKEIIR